MKNPISKWPTGLSAAAILVGAIALFAPRTEAQYASPVRLMNSPAAPGVVSNIDDHGRIPHQSTLTLACSATLCTFNFPPVPAGHRLVIESAAALCNVGTSSGPELMLLLVHEGISGAPIIPVPIPIVGTAAYGSGPAVVYVDTGQTPVVDAALGGTTFGTSNNEIVVLTGYMLDCSANSCAPIAH